MTHWHYEIPWVSDEYQSGVAGNVFFALGAVDSELDAALDFEHQGIRPMGEQGDHAGAYRAWETSEAIDDVIRNIRNICHQQDGLAPRAPFYAGDDGDALLQAAAERLARDGFDPLPLKYTPSVYECAMTDEACEAWTEYMADDDDADDDTMATGPDGTRLDLRSLTRAELIAYRTAAAEHGDDDAVATIDRLLSEGEGED